MTSPVPAKVLAALWATIVVGVPAAAQVPSTPAVLDLRVNTRPQGEIEVRLGDGVVWVDLAALTAAGITVTGGDRTAIGMRTFVDLASLAPDVTYVFDERALSLELTVSPSLLGTTIVSFASARPEGLTVTAAPSAFLNYGANWTSARTGALNLEAGVSVGRALATSTFFSTTTGRSVRGQTSLTFDDARRLTRYTIGDAIASTGVLGGAAQLAGVVVSRDYSLDPYFVRYATFGLSGAVTTPSRVEVYVNDQLVRVADIAPGSYQLDQLQLPTGAADTRVVVRDAFGGVQEHGASYYISTNVLARGLHQFQYAAGAERLHPFDRSWQYGRGAVLGAHRLGITDSLTLGGRVELRSDLASGGPVIAARLGRFGAVELAGGVSRLNGAAGAAGSVAYEFMSRTGGLSLAIRQASRDYATLVSGFTLPRREVAASGLLRAARRVTLGASWQALEYYQRPASRRASISANFSFAHRYYMYATGARSQVDGRWQTGFFAGLGVTFGPRDAANLSVEHDGSRMLARADVQRALPLGTGVGYRVRALGADGDGMAGEGELRARLSWAEIEARHLTIDGTAESWAQLSGGIVAIGGGLHATRPVRDGFALVHVPGVENVRTYLSHQEVGRTDGHGELVVPNLLAYYGNQISIADSDVPVDLTLSRNRLLLAPPYRGGAIAFFPATREWRITGAFRLASPGGGRPSNVSLRVEHADGVVESTVGPAGEFYLEGLEPGSYVARVGLAGARCEATLVVPDSDAPVIQLGEVPCEPRRDLPDR